MKLISAKTYLSLILILKCVSLSPLSNAQTEGSSSLGEGLLLLESAEFLLSDELNPPTGMNDWRRVTLPDKNSLVEVADNALGWYRLPIPSTSDSDTQTAVYLWRYGMNAAVYLNDQLLGDGGDIKNERIRNTHTPLLFILPPASYVTGQNYLFIQLKGVGGFARLMPPAFGDYQPLREQYDLRVLMQQTLPTILLVVVILVGLLSFIYSFSDSINSGYRFLSLACFCWLTYSLNPIIHEVPISMDFWRWSMHAGIDGFGVSLVFFAHRLTGVKRPKVEIGIAIVLLILWLMYALWSDTNFGLYATRMHLLTVLLGCYTISVLFNYYKASKELSALVFMIGILLFLPLALHDIFFSSLPLEQTWNYSFLATNLGAPVLFFALGADLTWAVHRSNSRLREALALERAALEERNRIYRDVHDDVGARLLSLIYNAENKAQENTARYALDDMRAAIKNNTQAIELTEFMMLWEEEVCQRCDEANISCTFKSNVSSQSLTAEVRYQLTKALRELLNNILRHSKATKLDIETLQSMDESLSIVIEDNGVGFDPEQQSSGTGLNSIRQRLLRINAELEWKNNGRKVLLLIPFCC